MKFQFENCINFIDDRQYIYSFLHFLLTWLECSMYWNRTQNVYGKKSYKTFARCSFDLIQSLCTTCYLYEWSITFTKPNYYYMHFIYFLFKWTIRLALLFLFVECVLVFLLGFHSIHLLCFEWMKMGNSWTSFNWWIWWDAFHIKNLYDSIVNMRVV